MEDKIEAILNILKNDFSGGNVTYHFANEYHKFRIEEAKLTYWLYMDRDFVDDSDKIGLVEMISTYRIIDEFKSSQKSLWLYLHDSGVREVDEHFTK